ncbi:MAG TPA: hypothetical protein PLI95_10600 [Polyangiaceae bacterium]|nr:hypothetical protein [Polyangiaceae bacterium]
MPLRTPESIAVSLIALVAGCVCACGSDHSSLLEGSAGTAGSAGSAGAAGSAGNPGQGGTSGSAGAAGSGCKSSDECSGATPICDLASGLCISSACQPGTSKCENNAVVPCSANGASWGPPQPCPSGAVCKLIDAQAGCAMLLCTPDSVVCQGDNLVTCSSDGTSIASSVDCASQGLHCAGGACSSLVCSPNAAFCDGSQIRQCNASGTGSQLLMTCSPGQYCDPFTTACVSLVCTPGQPACQGNFATKCNASGTGFDPGGVDCAALGKSCSNGACVGCAPGGIAPDAVRMVELYIGTDDYIVLQNRGSCPAQLDALWIRIDSIDSTYDFDFDVPAMTLGPNERVYVIDPAGAKPGDIAIPQGQNISMTYQSGETVSLCKGPCSSGVVLDFFSHASGAQPPSPPAGITFTPAPVTGITQANEQSHAYARIAYAGAYPAFKATDWQLAAASRPWVNPTVCPPVMPTTGDPCTGSDTCYYGASFCTCLSFIGWMCQ